MDIPLARTMEGRGGARHAQNGLCEKRGHSHGHGPCAARGGHGAARVCGGAAWRRGHGCLPAYFYGV